MSKPLEIENIINSFDSADTYDDVSETLITYIKSLGFDYCTYDLTSTSKEQKSTHFSNYPKQFVEHYIANRYARFDVMASYAATTLRPFTWSELSRKVDPTTSQIQVRHEGRESGLKSVGMIPIHGPGPVRAYVAVSNGMSPEEFDRAFAEKRHELQLIATYSHERMFNLQPKVQSIVKSRLTPREIEVLTWAASGKSNSDMAEILGVAESTIKDHFQTIFKKLGVKTKTHAVVIALSNGIISL